MTGRMCSWKACALALVLTLAASSRVWLEAQPLELDRELAEAKSFYASAEFTQATVRLQGVIGRLEQPPRSHAKDMQLAEAHLYLALSLVAIEDRVAARASLKAMLRRDQGRQLDPQVYAPKLIALLEEARAELAREAPRRWARIEATRHPWRRGPRGWSSCSRRPQRGRLEARITGGHGDAHAGPRADADARHTSRDRHRLQAARHRREAPSP